MAFGNVHIMSNDEHDKNFKACGISVDDSTNISDTAQLTILWEVSSFITEEILVLHPTKGSHTDAAIFKDNETMLGKAGLTCNRLVKLLPTECSGKDR